MSSESLAPSKVEWIETSLVVVFSHTSGKNIERFFDSAPPRSK